MENDNKPQSVTLQNVEAAFDLMGDTLPRTFVNMMLETNEVCFAR